MVEVKDRLEVDRLRNLTQGFGWEVAQEEYTDTHILITMKKARTAPILEVGAGPT